jgi:hypothetical protein
VKPNRRIWVSSKWLVFKRPSLAGFERPLTVREPALWTVFGQESKGHPSARGDAASFCSSPPGLVGASLSTRDN